MAICEHCGSEYVFDYYRNKRMVIDGKAYACKTVRGAIHGYVEVHATNAKGQAVSSHTLPELPATNIFTTGGRRYHIKGN